MATPVHFVSRCSRRTKAVEKQNRRPTNRTHWKDLLEEPERRNRGSCQMFYSLCFNINAMQLMLNVFADIQHSLHLFFEEFVLGVLSSVFPLSPSTLFPVSVSIACLFPGWAGLLPGSPPSCDLRTCNSSPDHLRLPPALKAWSTF